MIKKIAFLISGLTVHHYPHPLSLQRNKYSASFIPVEYDISTSVVPRCDDTNNAYVETEDGRIRAEAGGISDASMKLMQRRKELNEATRERPTDELVWLELAEFQDEVGSTAIDSPSIDIHSSTKATSTKVKIKERKIEILKRGLSHCPKSEVLVLGLLVNAEGIISDHEVVELWNQSLKTHGESVILIRAYVHFCTRHFPGFNIKV